MLASSFVTPVEILDCCQVPTCAIFSCLIVQLGHDAGRVKHSGKLTIYQRHLSCADINLCAAMDYPRPTSIDWWLDQLCIANPDSFMVGKTTSSVSWCGNTFYCNDVRIFECSVIDTCSSSTTYILNLTYKIQIDHGVSHDQAVVGENWLMDSHNCPSNMDQGIGTKTCGLDNVPPPPPPPPPHTHTHTPHTDDLKFA